jgi:hypothetical protein
VNIARYSPHNMRLIYHTFSAIAIFSALNAVIDYRD